MELNAVCYLTRQFDQPWTWENYLRIGGYESWRRILAENIPPETVIEQIMDERFRDESRSEHQDLLHFVSSSTLDVSLPSPAHPAPRNSAM